MNSKRINKIISIIMCVLFLALSMPLSASANDAVYYLDGNGNPQSVTDYTVVTHNNNTPVTWTNGWYVVNENTQINGRITVSGIVHLIILDGVLLNVTGGIEVDEGNYFFVYGQGLSNGVLGATSSGNYAPAIGSTSLNDDPVNYGTIVINGCTVNAICTSGYWAAAIGSGEGASGGDNIIINRGTVTATASTSSSGAGIGGGNKSSGGNITINGGTVNATSGNNGGAGIGGGGGDCGESGNITINGGTVTAVSTSSYGANIGSGGYAAVNSITINGGTVTAVSEKYGSGIGTGYSGKGGTIRITDGDITASCKGTGIGGGGNSGEIDSITITGGKVSAVSTGTASCPGIGGHSGSMVINISGGEITAVGGDYGAGIGGSWTTGGNTGDCSGGTITISGGVVNATGGKMATAIGGGYNTDCKEINFNGGQVTAVSGQNGYGVGGSQYHMSEGRVNFNLANADDFVLSDNYMCDNISFAYTHYIDNTQTVATADNITGNKVVKNATVSTIHYVGADGSDQTQTGYNTIVSSTAAQTWTTGWYVVSGNTALTKRVVVSGTVNLILCDGVTFNPKKGITVNEGNTLNIYCQSVGDGALTVDNCDGYMAAIGSNSGSTSTGVNCGTITINGGIITANGPQYYGAGIGGAVKGTGGTITINGGTVTATGGASSAGIGGSSETSGNITINGGTVTATGGTSAAGIGGGSYKDADTITINGGTVTATGGTSGAGIGGGTAHGYTAITITGGNITANGGATNATSGVPAAGIGAGYRTSSSNAVNFGPLTLGWKTEDDSITVNSISTENLTFEKDFYIKNTPYVATESNIAGNTLLPITLGDLDADGDCDENDYAVAKSALTGADIGNYKLAASDLNKDLAVDAYDLYKIDRKINGIVS